MHVPFIRVQKFTEVRDSMLFRLITSNTQWNLLSIQLHAQFGTANQDCGMNFDMMVSQNVTQSVLCACCQQMNDHHVGVWTCNRKPPIDKRASCIGMLCENASSLSHETRIRFAHCIGWENRGKTNPIIRHSLASMRERLDPLRHRTKPHLWSSQLPALWWVVVNYWWRHCGEGLQHETAWLLVQGIIEGGSFGSPSLWKWYSTTAPFFQKSRDFILHPKKIFFAGTFSADF